MLSRRDVADFVHELQRRRVFRVAVWYAAAAWATIQLATTVFPLIGLSERAEQIVLVCVVLAAPVTFVLAWIFDVTPQGLHRTEPLSKPGSAPRRTALRGGKSIVVLPFRDLTGGKSDYFADGVTEDIITALTVIGDLRVISRTSAMQYRRTDKTAPRIAAELGVAHVLEGSIRKEGGRVRIAARLVDAHTDEHLWAETYDRMVEDIFAIQSDVAQHIASSLKAELSSAERALIERPPTQHVEAYEAYLRGRHLWNMRTEESISQAIANLRGALDIDPDFMLAWAGLAEAYVTMAMYGAAAPAEVMPLARIAAGRALALDPDSVAARVPLAAVRLHHDWDWNGAEHEYQRAIETNPRWATAHHWYANMLAAAGRFGEARTALGKARELDPLAPAIGASAGIISYFERDRARAAEELAGVIALHPGFALAHMFMGIIHSEEGRESEAMASFRAAMQHGGVPEAPSALACALARAGRTVEARTILGQLHSERYVSPVLPAFIHAALDEPAAALECLATAVEMRAADLVWLRVRPAADPLRSLPGFHALLQPVFAGMETAPPDASLPTAAH